MKKSIRITENFLFTQEQFNKSTTFDLIPLNCIFCKNAFNKLKKIIVEKGQDYSFYCSRVCNANSRILKKEFNCKNCNQLFTKVISHISKNNFCSQSCACTFNNKNKTHGTRRSKIEVYLEQQLTTLFPTLEILYSNKKIIGSELDIYIPSLKLAFEIQGIFHYKPIYGEEKLEQIQKNDLEKIQKCKELEINLIHIDISKQKVFKPETSQIYLQDILNNINMLPHTDLDSN